MTSPIGRAAVGSRDDPRARAYRAAAGVARERMRREAPLDAEALERIEASDVLVVPGSYDHVELVLGALETPFTPLDPWPCRRCGSGPSSSSW